MKDRPIICGTKETALLNYYAVDLIQEKLGFVVDRILKLRASRQGFLTGVSE